MKPQVHADLVVTFVEHKHSLSDLQYIHVHGCSSVILDIFNNFTDDAAAVSTDTIMNLIQQQL